MPVTDYVSVNYGYSNVYGHQGHVHDIVLQLKEYNLWAILIVSAKLAVIFSNKEFKSKEEQTKLLRSFFGDSTLEKIGALLFNRKKEELNDKWLFFNEPPLLNLVSLALSVCPEEDGKDMSTAEDLEKFGAWLLILAEKWTQKMEAPAGLQCQKSESGWRLSRYAVEGMRRSFAEQNFLNNRPNILHNFARVSLITKLCEGNPYGINIDQLFKEATNVTIEDYIGFGFVILIHWSPDMGDTDLENAVIRNMGFFRNTSIDSDKLNLLLSLFSAEPENFNSENEDIVKFILKGRSYDNNFMMFMRKPIVISKTGSFMCISQRYLVQRASDGVYWQMNEFLNRTNDSSRLPRLPQAWGYGFEKYINQRLSSGFGIKYVENYRDTNNNELADGLILGSRALFIIETKAVHVPYKTQLNASRANMKSTLRQILGSKQTKNKNKKHKRKGLQQILYLSNLFLSHTLSIDNYDIPKMIIPIIVTEDDIPVDPLNRRYYNGYSCSVNGTYDRKTIQPFILLNVEEAEYLESIACNNSTKAEELLIEYSQKQNMVNDVGMPTEVGSFKNFLDVKGIKLNNTTSLSKEFHLITENIRRHYFPKGQEPEV